MFLQEVSAVGTIGPTSYSTKKQLFADMLTEKSWKPIVILDSNTGKETAHFENHVEFSEISAENNNYPELLSLPKFNRYVTSMLRNSLNGR